MLFTAGQIRSTFSLSKQQWRSYREYLPPLAKESTRSHSFSAADLLSVSVVRCLSEVLSAPLSTFTPIADGLFDLFGTTPWPQLERSTLLVDLGRYDVVLLDADCFTASAELALLVKLAPLMSELRGRLLAEGPAPQRDLFFPPMVAGGGR